MSNKEKLTEEECQQRQNEHLYRTIRELGYEEIPQTEYKRLKRDDIHNANGYTIRIRFKYFKQKSKPEKPLIDKINYDDENNFTADDVEKCFKSILKEVEKEMIGNRISYYQLVTIIKDKAGKEFI